jgi:Tfp pilus assembly protein PilX
MAMLTRRHESGAVSLFLVVFAMLLITIVTLSFLRIMITDQQQASLSDLSQSAYDSSLAGVEDAKRALIYYQTSCNNDASTCNAQKNIINSTSCNTGLQKVVPSVTAANDKNPVIEIPVAQSSGDAALNQAYTCVVMKLETPDYLGTVQANTSKLIPLKSTKPFTSVTVEWYMSSDLGTKDTKLDLTSLSDLAKPLYQQGSWPSNRPSLMRAQLIQFGPSFTLGSFDSASSSSAISNANTIFIYPTSSGAEPPVKDTTDFTSTGAPKLVRCVSDLSAGGYACTVTITLPRAIGQSSDDHPNTYLRLTPIYNATHYRVTLGGDAQFDGVQPSIDSTGRANKQFRRVNTRVDLVDTSFPFPEAAIDLTGNFCKDFIVTNAISDYAATCKP